MSCFRVPDVFFAMAEMVQPKKVAGGAYGQFLAEKRPELQAQCIGQPITAVTKLASEKFKALSEKDKAIYEEKYQAAKAKYEEDMKAFLDAGGEKKAIQRKGKMEKKKKDPEAPKKPTGGAYGCFMAKNRKAFQEQTKGQPATAVSKMGAAKWKELSEKDKKIYEDEYQKKKEEYEEAKKSYVPPSQEGESDEPPAKKRKTKEDQAKAEAKAAKGKKAEAKPKAAGA